MNELIIETTDPEFLNDLKKANIPDIEIWEPMNHAHGLMDISLGIFQLSIEFSKDIAAGYIAAWLFDRLNKISSHETTINKKRIPDAITVEELLKIIKMIKKKKKQAKNK
jgi:hypothetical protein